MPRNARAPISLLLLARLHHRSLSGISRGLGGCRGDRPPRSSGNVRNRSHDCDRAFRIGSLAGRAARPEVDSKKALAPFTRTWSPPEHEPYGSAERKPTVGDMKQTFTILKHTPIVVSLLSKRPSP